MFAVGFTKIADNAATGGSNNQGMSFATADTNNSTANVGPGGMTPAGLESFQPVQPQEQKQNPLKKSKHKMTENEIAAYLMSKSAKVDEISSRGVSRQADGVVKGLKYDQESVDQIQDEVISKINAEKAGRKAYIKAGLK
jgi:hypothetical protein